MVENQVMKKKSPQIFAKPVFFPQPPPLPAASSFIFHISSSAPAEHGMFDERMGEGGRRWPGKKRGEGDGDGEAINAALRGFSFILLNASGAFEIKDRVLHFELDSGPRCCD